MEPKDFRRLAFFKVTFHCITNLAPQRLHGFRFSENGMTQGASGISAFRRFFDEKDNFVHLVRARRPLTLPRISTIRRSFSRKIWLVPQWLARFERVLDPFHGLGLTAQA